MTAMVPFYSFGVHSRDPFVRQAEQALIEMIGELANNRGRFANAAKSKVEYPKTDIVQPKDSNQLVFELAIPGYKQEDFKITYERGVLQVSGSKLKRTEYKDEDYLDRQMTNRSWIRCWEINEAAIKSDEITANLEDGILRITVPLVEPKKIEVTRKQIAVS